MLDHTGKLKSTVSFHLMHRAATAVAADTVITTIITNLAFRQLCHLPEQLRVNLWRSDYERRLRWRDQVGHQSVSTVTGGQWKIITNTCTRKRTRVECIV